MANKDESAPGGLLSRVVRFVRNPGSGFAEGEGETDRESSYSKQMLKEMIERKRRNDFVRKREFDMLRKMRRSEVLAGTDPGLRPSFFQSSMPSKPDDRATTLKKIDEIEAQMSMQWWKTKHGNSTQQSQAPGSGFTMSSHMTPEALRQQGAPAGASYTRTSPDELDGAETVAPAQGPNLFDSVPPGTTQPMATAAPVAQPEPAPVNRLVPPARPGTAPAPSRLGDSLLHSREMASAGAPSVPGAPSTFSPSKQFAIQVEEFAHDPELEEASIRFANGDNEGAEAGLLEVLGPEGSRVNHDETWLTLFDLYRAAGWQERFEGAAIDFASRFGRSAPQWFSMPDIIGRLSAPAQAVAAPGQQVADWNCPVVFGTQTLAAMNAAIARGNQPFKLNWTKLNSIAEAAIEPLTKTFTQWAGQATQLRFIGSESLEKVLKDATPSSDRSVNPAWWKLRMEVLRVMHRPDEFELVALDYCVTYEVSPPSWESARCDYKAMQADGSYATRNTIVGEAFRDSVVSSVMNYGESLSPMSSQLSSVATVELSGQILGDGKEALELLDAKLEDADIMIISCARLMRIDFTAAGTLLNWVSARVAEGRQVQFSDVHRLVAAFFNVIGISEHARITIRNE